MKRFNKLIAAVLAAAALCTSALAEADTSLLLHSPAMEAEHIDPADYTAHEWTTDMVDTGRLPPNFRTMLSEFRMADKKYGFGDGAAVSRDGLEQLHMSGSGQYTQSQFLAMVEELEQFTDRSNIIVIDLRQESHIFVNDTAISRWGERNWGNLGRSADEIEAEEADFARQLAGTTITVRSSDDKKHDNEAADIEVVTAVTEREVVESAGLTYYRLSCTDRIWPDADQIDAFIQIYKTLPDDAWLHFHCVAGKGRTGALMCIYDIMRNPDVSLKDIAARQYLFGANYLLSGGGSSWTAPYKAEVALMLTAFSCYAKECGPDGYQRSWSDWLVNR